MLIEHNLTKTEMRKQAGISTNILAKMGKGEPVAMESLAKICATLQCSLADIVDKIFSSAKEGLPIINPFFVVSFLI